MFAAPTRSRCPTNPPPAASGLLSGEFRWLVDEAEMRALGRLAAADVILGAAVGHHEGGDQMASE